jgi:hypothetical protein
MAPVTLLAAVLLNGLKRDRQCIAYWVVHGARPTSTDARVSTPGMTLQFACASHFDGQLHHRRP